MEATEIKKHLNNMNLYVDYYINDPWEHIINILSKFNSTQRNKTADANGKKLSSAVEPWVRYVASQRFTPWLRPLQRPVSLTQIPVQLQSQRFSDASTN